MQPYLFAAIPLLCLSIFTQSCKAMEKDLSPHVHTRNSLLSMNCSLISSFSEEKTWKQKSTESTFEEAAAPPKRKRRAIACDTLGKKQEALPINDRLFIEWQKQTDSNEFHAAIERIAKGSNALLLTGDGWFVDSEIDCIISIFSYVTTVVLDNYEITLTQMEQLMRALKDNTSIEKLSLKNTSTGYASAEKISDMLRYNHTIKVLYLSHNHIGPRGVKLICEGIQSNPSSALIELNLRYNRVSLEDTLAVYSPLIKFRPNIVLYSEYSEIDVKTETLPIPEDIPGSKP